MKFVCKITRQHQISLMLYSVQHIENEIIGASHGLGIIYVARDICDEIAPPYGDRHGGG